MPNWVYNSLHCHGSEADLDALAEFLTKEIRINKWDSETRTDYHEDEVVPFTYMAIRDPFSPPYNVDPDEYHGTNGFVDGERVGDTANNWYNWNSTHWGVKWDATRVDVDRNEEIISYHFESPWGPPWEEMMLELSERFPTIAFTHRYDEEQGWGGEYELQSTRNWIKLVPVRSGQMTLTCGILTAHLLRSCKMPKYQLNYQILSDFQVVVEAEDEEAARDILIDSPNMTTDVGGEEPEWIMTDIYYDTIDIMEVED